jgi:hypothetical protein
MKSSEKLVFNPGIFSLIDTSDDILSNELLFWLRYNESIFEAFFPELIDSFLCEKAPIFLD